MEGQFLTGTSVTLLSICLRCCTPRIVKDWYHRRKLSRLCYIGYTESRAQIFVQFAVKSIQCDARRLEQYRLTFTASQWQALVAMTGKIFFVAQGFGLMRERFSSALRLLSINP